VSELLEVPEGDPEGVGVPEGDPEGVGESLDVEELDAPIVIEEVPVTELLEVPVAEFEGVGESLEVPVPVGVD
jgi:hypothetical protein